MVRIRLLRIGKKKRPFYRIVVTDSRKKRDGEVCDIIGFYDPLKKEGFDLKLDKYEEWIRKGAQTTSRVKALVKLYKKLKKEDEATPAETINKDSKGGE